MYAVRAASLVLLGVIWNPTRVRSFPIHHFEADLPVPAHSSHTYHRFFILLISLIDFCPYQAVLVVTCRSKREVGQAISYPYGSSLAKIIL